MIKDPNTGGMGAYSPAPVVTPQISDRVSHDILAPLLAGLRKRGVHYRGVIYVGLMITKDGPQVLEFNVRFGDPECQPIMMRLKSDLIPLIEATIEGKLDQIHAEWHADPAVCVVLCAEGYPGSYDKGKEIHGLEKLKNWPHGFVFHAGTVKNNGGWLTSGGASSRRHGSGRDHHRRSQRSLSRGRRDFLGRHALPKRHCPAGDKKGPASMFGFNIGPTRI